MASNNVDSRPASIDIVLPLVLSLLSFLLLKPISPLQYDLILRLSALISGLRNPRPLFCVLPYPVALLACIDRCYNTIRAHFRR